MDRIGVNPDETLYIGDSVEHDVAGARVHGPTMGGRS
jgi:FMN phosphatase YigB (HAD superfamily)